MLTLLWAACAGGPAEPPPKPAPAEPAVARERQGPPNVLLVILDDVGVDRVAAYGETSTATPTPTLSGLAAEGVLFRNAWVHPYCSATRAAIQTGRYAGRTNIGYVVFPDEDGVELAPDEVTLPELLARAPDRWDSSLVGKWHLGTERSGTAASHPGRQGYAWWASTDHNVDGPGGYFRWKRNLNGVEAPTEAYATTVQADDAIARAKEMAEPWLLTLALNAAHAPLHAPPEALSGPLPPDATDADRYDALLRAADAELGRVLGSLEPELRARTLVIVIGDNGTMHAGVRPPQDPEKAKGTVFEGGVNVPLLVSGPLVAKPGESQALVHAVDLFATLADLAHVDVSALPNPIDGLSLLPALADPSATIHRLVYTEQFQPNGPPEERKFFARAIRGKRYKLMVVTRQGKTREFLFDLEGRTDDGPDLLTAGPLSPDAREALALLRTELSKRDGVPAGTGTDPDARKPASKPKQGGPAKAKQRKGGAR